ncbi:MAG: ATP-binding protein [Spirochaetia bacterium]|nr:ATP-binding protein [Spirochaetia bacterium]
MLLKIISIFLLSFISFASLSAAEFINISDNNKKIDLTNIIGYYLQKKGKPSPFEKPVEFTDSSILRKLNSTQSENLWVSFKLNNIEPQVLNRLLSWTYTRKSITLWRLNGSKKEKLDHRVYRWLEPYPGAPHFLDHFSFAVNPGENDFLMRIEAIDAGHLFITLWEETALNERTVQDNSVFAFLIGILFIMIFYNLALYFSFKDIYYLYFAGYILTGIIGFPFRDHFYQAWLNLNLSGYEYELLIFRSILALSFIFMIKYIYSFLKINNNNPIYKYLKIFFYLFSVVLAISPFFASPILYNISILLCAGSIFGILVRHTLLPEAKNSAFWLLVSFGLFNIGSILEMLRVTGVLGDFYRYFMASSVVTQIIILSFFMSARINRLRKEKDETQKIMLKNSEQYAANLEKQVAERTKELKRQTAELTLANETKKKFFSILAHDLRAPIGSLSVYFNEILEKNKVIEDKLLDMIRHSTKNIYNLLEDLLSWSRNQQGDIKFQPESVNIKKSINKILELYMPQTETKKIKFKSTISPDLWVHADIDMLKTIMRNLINNAVKFTEKDGEISIDAKRKNKVIEISVSDTGIGISPENISKIFKLDSINRRPSEHSGEGTGLGLILCKDFVEKHRGKISVKSRLKEGTRFSFTLPAATDGAIQSAEALDSAQFITGQKILLVEDDKLHLETSARILTSLDCYIDHAESGEEALNLTRKNQYIFIFMDIDLPFMSGIEAAEKIRLQTKVTPFIIALTSYSKKELSELSHSARFDGYLKKPFSREELISVFAAFNR